MRIPAEGSARPRDVTWSMNESSYLGAKELLSSLGSFDARQIRFKLFYAASSFVLGCQTSGMLAGDGMERRSCRSSLGRSKHHEIRHSNLAAKG